MTVESGVATHIRFEGVKQPHMLIIHAEMPPKEVTLDGAAVKWQYDPKLQRLTIRNDVPGKAEYVLSF